MKKRMVSLFMVACLMLTLAPAVLAVNGSANEWCDLPDNVPTTLTRPDGEVVNIPDFPAISTMSVSSNDSNVIEIGTVQQFLAADWLSGKSYVLTADLNFNTVSSEAGAWTALVSGFYAYLDGDGHTISGIAEDHYLIDYCVGGEIKNLTFDVGNNAAFLVFGPATIGGQCFPLKLTNINVIGNVELANANQSNYSPFIYASNPGLIMEGCKNYADISGVTYAAVFYGYSTITGGSYKFLNCENHGNIDLRYGALFFGNPTYLSDSYVSEKNVTVEISGCKNFGQIRSTSTDPHYFVTDVGGGLSTFSQNIEAQLIANNCQNSMLTIGGACEDVLCQHRTELSHDGKLYVGEGPEGLGLTLNEDGETLTIQRATNEDDLGIAYYEVTVSAYVTVAETEEGGNGTIILKNFRGSEQRSVSDYVDLPGDSNQSSIDASLKYWGFADHTIAGEENYIGNNLIVATSNGNFYVIEEYQMPSITYPAFNVYASSSSFDENGIYVGSTGNPHGAFVSAYNNDDELIGRAYLGG